MEEPRWVAEEEGAEGAEGAEGGEPEGVVEGGTGS